ncbi:hypothetical protein EMIT0P218_70176 [Pseudomonas sp. IT-P218]
MHNPAKVHQSPVTMRKTLSGLYPVGAAAGCDLLILKTKSKDRSLRQLLQGFGCVSGRWVGEGMKTLRAESGKHQAGCVYRCCLHKLML